MYDLIFTRYCLNVGHVEEGLKVSISDEAELEAGYQDQYNLLMDGTISAKGFSRGRTSTIPLS
jgi:hypothetical protein